MMELAFNVFTIINLSILSTILYFQKSNSITNKILAVIIFIPAINFINNVFILQGWIYEFPHTLFFSFATAQLYAPAVYIYVNLFIGKNYKRANPLYALTLFIIILDLFFWWDFLQLPNSEKVVYLEGLTTNNYPWQMNAINGLFVIAEFAYFLAAIMNVNRYSKIAKEYYSDEDHIKLRYIWKFILLIFSLNAALTLIYILLPTPNVEYVFIPLFINFIYLYILFNAFRHAAIFSFDEFNMFVTTIQPIALVKENIPNKEKLLKSNYHINQELGDHLCEKIQNYFIEKKPYLDSNFHIDNLAHDLKVGKHHLSYVINSRFKKSFFELINSYRIEEAKIKLKEISRSHSVDSIGYEVGFNTKSAFYRAFKKFTNQTPAQYAKN